MPRIATKQINFRVTAEEAATLELNAARVGVKIPTYCKSAALGVKVKPQVIDKEMGKAILPHISHMGSNINQLAKRANEGGTVAAAELAEVKAEFEQLWDFVLYGKKPKPRKSEEEKMEQATGQMRLEQAAKTCSKCGETAIRKHSTSSNRDYYICPNYSKNDKGHLFEWVEE